MAALLSSTGGLAQWFAVIGEPTRIAILRELAAGSRCVTELARALDTEMANVSHHVRLMQGAGLVTSERRGRHVIYTLAGVPERLKDGGLRLAHAATGAAAELPPPPAPEAQPRSATGV